MLRKIRILSGILFFAGITLLFLDFTGSVHRYLAWMAKAQFLPALLALNLAVVGILVAATLLFGRIYCSVICPLGVFQDIVSYLSGYNRKRRLRFGYVPGRTAWRSAFLILFILLMVAGLNGIAILIAPYSAYGRIATTLFQPLYRYGNNLLGYFAERADSYRFYSVEVWMKSASSLLIAGATMFVVGVLAWKRGRTWCNAVCPVGTVLGYLSRYSLMRPVIDLSKCNGCGVCARGCKASCIDSKEHRIDYSRCVTCFDCIGSCRQDAIRYQPVTGRKAEAGSEERTDGARRKFLSLSVLFASGAVLKAQQKKVDGGLAVIADRKIPERSVAILPAGAQSANNLHARCTGCQLCVAACPNNVLRPSGGLSTLMQPELSYERGFCRPECVACSEVCPTGAIRKTDRAQKSSTQIGHAVWISDNCVVLTDGVSCGNCQRHCPAGAIFMVPNNPDDPESPKVPAINTERCIGCGACEYHCPSRPFSAIYVEGHRIHREV